MAIYHFSAKTISRSRGQSAIACAAYRAGDKLYDEKYDVEHDYTRKGGVLHNEILLPEGADAGLADRQTLWNRVEQTEKRKDAQLAREIEISLPREQSLAQNIELVKAFLQDQFVAKGMIADLAIHDVHASDGEGQPHAHVMLTMREVKGSGFGQKVRSWNDREQLAVWREQWAEYTNCHLAKNGIDQKIDHRSYADQGIDLVPQKKRGPDVWHRQEAHRVHEQTARENGERLLQKPNMVLDILTRQQSTFTQQDIARIVNRYTADAAQFQSVFEKVKASPDLVCLGIDDNRQKRFTTHEMLQLEARMMHSAGRLSERGDHGVDQSHVGDVVKTQGLSAEQGRVLEHIVAEGDLRNVVGYAGTGKSRLLGAAKSLWEEAGYRVHGATLSGIAAENLQSGSNIESRTLASRMHYWDRGEQLPCSKDVIVIDEAGMVGSGQMARVLDLAERAGAKVVLVGDPEQLQAIQAGAAFRSLVTEMGCVELSEIWRQQTDWQREATAMLATGRTPEAIRQYADHDSVHVYDKQDEARRAMVSDWNDSRLSDSNKTQIMLAYTRKDVLALNEMARAARKSLGELGEDHLILTERGERLFAEGEQVYFLKNDRELDVKNGTLGKITQVGGKSLTVSLRQEGREGQSIHVDLNTYNHLDYGYAATIHKSQGLTVDRTLVLASDYMDRHATYVAMTRHRESADLFWSREAFSAQEKLLGCLSKERPKDTSIDHIDEGCRTSFASYRGMDVLWETFREKIIHRGIEKISSAFQIVMGSDNCDLKFVDVIRSKMEIIQEIRSGSNEKSDKFQERGVISEKRGFDFSDKGHEME